MSKQKEYTKNRALIYKGPGQVELEDLPFPTLDVKRGKMQKSCEYHGAIIKVVSSGICGSDGHMYRGRTHLKPGLVLGHEMLGEVIEVGSSVEYIKVGDLVSVPFCIGCGFCNNCKSGIVTACLTVNETQPGGLFGYVDGGGWPGGQAEFNVVPYADFNLLKIPNKEKAMNKLADLTMLSDIFPTGFHAAFNGGVKTGSTVYIAGAGPVGLCCAQSCFILGASHVIVGDNKPDRLGLAKQIGCRTIDINKNTNITQAVEEILGEPFVDVGIDCVGYEAHGCGDHVEEHIPAQALNDVISVTRASGFISIPGVYLLDDPKASEKEKKGMFPLEFAKAWTKGLTVSMGQTPVPKYNHALMKLILADKVQIAKAVNATIISLDEAPKAYQEFHEKSVAKKFIIDPHNMFKTPV